MPLYDKICKNLQVKILLSGESIELIVVLPADGSELSIKFCL